MEQAARWDISIWSSNKQSWNKHLRLHENEEKQAWNFNMFEEYSIYLFRAGLGQVAGKKNKFNLVNKSH